MRTSHRSLWRAALAGGVAVLALFMGSGVAAADGYWGASHPNAVADGYWGAGHPVAVADGYWGAGHPAAVADGYWGAGHSDALVV